VSEPRFVVTEFIGYPITDGRDERATAPVASYYVKDTFHLYRVVETVEHRRYRAHFGRPALRRKAERIAERLNADWNAELAHG
jgi:hypothetical protein